MAKRFALVGFFLLASLLVAGCGAGDGPAEVTVTMKEFAFEPDSLSVQAGSQVSLTIINLGALEHNFLIMDAGSEVSGSWSESDRANALLEQQRIAGGETLSVEFTVPSQPGTYQFLCSVPAHLEQGMEGVLTVTE